MVKLENMRLRRKSRFPCVVRRGSGDPTLASVWPTLRKAPSTVRLRTGRWLVLMAPVRKRWAKTWRKGIGSSKCSREGSMDNVAQKECHRRQWAEAAAAFEGTTPEATVSCAVRRSRRKQSRA